MTHQFERFLLLLICWCNFYHIT